MDPNSISLIAESTDWGFVSIVVQFIVSLTTCIAMLFASWKWEFMVNMVRLLMSYGWEIPVIDSS
jgi:hypothetical protein